MWNWMRRKSEEKEEKICTKKVTRAVTHARKSVVKGFSHLKIDFVLIYKQKYTKMCQQLKCQLIQGVPFYAIATSIQASPLTVTPVRVKLRLQ